MKLIKKITVFPAPALLCLGLIGCSSPETVTPVTAGYEEVTHPNRWAESSSDTRISLQYRSSDGRITRVWPSLYGVPEVIHGNTAVFVGDVAFQSSDPDNPRGLRPRLFAVQAPALPLDITDEILRRWSQANGKNFAKAQQLFSLATPADRNGRIELQLEFWTQELNWPDKSVLALDWSEVTDVMRAVKEKGTMHKDLRWKTPYIAR